MKEYCLVPRATAEKILLKSTSPLKREKLVNTQPSPARVTPNLEGVIHVKKNDNNNNNNKPSIEHLVTLSGTVKAREYLLDLLEILKQNPEVSWDSYGNTLRPITGINLPHTLKILTEHNKIFNNEELPLIRIFMHSVPRLSQYIRNGRAYKQIYNASPIIKQGGRMKKKRKMPSESYLKEREMIHSSTKLWSKKRKNSSKANAAVGCSWLSYY